MVELSIKLDEPEVQRRLANVWVTIDEHIVIGTILLQALILDSSWNVRIARGPDEGLRDA